MGKKSADRQVEKEDIIAFLKNRKPLPDVVKNHLRANYKKLCDKRVLADEKNKFKLLLKRSKRFGTVNVDPFLYQIIDEPIIKRIIKLLEPYLHNIQLNSFFHPIFNLKIKDLIDFAEITGLDKEDISRYIAENLLSCDEKQTDDAPLTFYVAFYRLPLIHKCEKILNYPLERIKEIARFDNFIVKAFQEFSFGELKGNPVFLFKDLSGTHTVFLRKSFEWLFDLVEFALSKKETSEKIIEMLTQKQKANGHDSIDFLKYLADFDFNRAPIRERTFVSLWSILIWMILERWKISFIRFFHKGILLGYSPQVLFQGHKRTHYSSLEPSGEINWKRTLEMTRAAIVLTFFRTPEFEVDLQEGKITIRVFDPAKVDSSVLRKVEKVYNIFRQRLNPPRTKWGTKTGIKKEKEEMYWLIKEEFKKMRMETSLKVPEILDEIRKKGVPLSDERIKAIVYGMKK